MGCLHYVISTHGGFLIAIDFIAPESSKALAALISSGVERSTVSRQKGLFENFSRSIELGLNNNQITTALSSWIRVQEATKEWAERNDHWKKIVSKVWDRFFRNGLSQDVLCPCQMVEPDESFEEHFRAVHMFSHPGTRGSPLYRPSKRRKV